VGRDLPADSALALSVDLLVTRTLVWFATAGRGGELNSDTRIYLYDRYSRLAACHRVRGRTARAARLQAKADAYFTPGGPPYAAAMAMPHPRRFLQTDAVSRLHFDPPDDAA
jgi:hypothetical protein